MILLVLTFTNVDDVLMKNDQKSKYDLSCTDSNYEFEMDNHEAKSVWRDHIGIDQNSHNYESRLRRPTPSEFKDKISSIDHRDETHTFHDVEIVFEDEHRAPSRNAN